VLGILATLSFVVVVVVEQVTITSFHILGPVTGLCISYVDITMLQHYIILAIHLLLSTLAGAYLKFVLKFLL
jgi:hypothetical protein